MPTFTKFTMALLMAAMALCSLNASAEEDSSATSNETPSLVPAPPKNLSKDQEDACTMLLCLEPDGKSQVECHNPLEKYNDMKPHKRPGFLALCPK